MTAVDELWFIADEAERQAEQAYHRVRQRHEEFMEPSLSRRVSRDGFRLAARRGKETGAPYGAQALVYRESGELLLVRHSGVGKWVLPGGEVGPDESFREAAARELAEEAGVEASFEGLAMCYEVEIRCDGHRTWGIIPVFAARAETRETRVDDPDGEITDARWFDDLPADARDREVLERWRERRF